MLTRIIIKNFRGIKSAEILNLGKINLFIGRNNVGKSCILEAICFIRCLFYPSLLNEPLPYLLLERRGMERPFYTTRNFWYNYRTENNIFLELEFRKSEKLNIEIVWVSDDRFRMLLNDPSGKLSTSIGGKYFYLVELYLNGSIYQSAGNLSDFIYSYPEFSHYLKNITLIDDYLARKLERLETNIYGKILEPRLDKKLVKELNECYGIEAEGLAFIPASPTTRTFRLAVTTPKESLHIDEIGDGTKYAANILSLCLLLENTALLIEEVESHQHSSALEKFLRNLVDIAIERNIQLFVTTHSLEVIQILSKLTEKYDIRFFHLIRSTEGELTVREIPGIDTKLLSDFGLDMRRIETYKKFIVIEGNEDEVFLEQLFKKYGKILKDLAYVIKAWSKEQVKNVVVALSSTGKEIIAMQDYDKNKREEIIESFSKTLENRYSFELKDNVFKIKERDSIIIILPMGLPNDETLMKVGITQHEMEDYCLKLIALDENVRKWTSLTLEELAEDAKRAKFRELNKSSTLLRVLAGKKGIAYENLIRSIIENANIESLGKTIRDLEILLKQ
jgi:5S rRNA maturation endonuclease (ribonuclease M5)